LFTEANLTILLDVKAVYITANTETIY